MLSVLSSIGIILCMYVLVSKKYRTKTVDVTLLFLFFNIIFTCKLWLSLDPAFIMTPVYIGMNYFTFIALLLCIIGVRKTVVLDKGNINYRIYKVLIPIIDKIKTKYNNIKIRIMNK